MIKLTAITATLFSITISNAYAGSATIIDVFPSGIEAPAATNWAGAYVGGFGSYEFGNIAVNDQSSLGGGGFQFIDIPVGGAAAGVLGGYNWQRGNMVYGIEADYSFGGATGNSIVDIANEDETLEWETNWSSSIRGRVGVANNGWLFYGTAGIAFAEANVGLLNMDNSLTVVESDDREDQSFSGWSAGAGVEKMIGEHLVIRGEYLFSQYGEVAFPVVPNSGDIGYTPSISTVRAAIIWSF